MSYLVGAPISSGHLPQQETLVPRSPFMSKACLEVVGIILGGKTRKNNLQYKVEIFKTQIYVMKHSYTRGRTRA